MKVIVYGTLKRGYNNNPLLKNAEFIRETVLSGYKLFYSFEKVGFPVARKSDGDSLKGELYEIDPEDKSTLYNLDRLESEGVMYVREQISEDTYMYVGHEKFWNFSEMNECPNENNIYVWGR